MQKVWFTADTHFRHKNILLHCEGRRAFTPDDIDAHDRWVMETWNNTVAKNDIVYVIGDFSFAPAEKNKILLGKLHGHKHLIVGNHDKSSDHLVGYFKTIQHIRAQVFKKSVFDFLAEDFQVFLCHYPMVTWSSKHYGCVNIHGHCHGRLDDYNDASTDLRVDVGWDSRLANYNLVSLETLYKFFKQKANGEMLHEYAKTMQTKMDMVI